MLKRGRFYRWVNAEVDKQLDKESFFSLPLQTRLGIFILVASFVIGYGGPVLIVALSGANKKLAAVIFGGAFLYIFSWVLGAAGLAMAGRDCIKYPIYFFAKFTKIIFRGYFSKE